LTKTLFRIERFASEIPDPVVVLTLPWPPSVNHYWRHAVVGHRPQTYISAEGKRFRADVEAACLAAWRGTLTGRLAVEILATMPDHRARDIDNLAKATLDALQYAGVFQNDNQIDRLVVARAGVEPPGRIEVRIAVL
jgi:crossover junction endodeoxyribonuclease RusA